MQTENRLLDDLAKVASGALHTLGGLKDEIETRMRERLERVASDLDLVTREEFDAVKAMAAKARAAQEELEEKVARLEAALAGTAEGTVRVVSRGGKGKNKPAEPEPA
ncbi:MAG: accessory factor UbiK family protein [Geminicoccaceae bacterium]